MGLGGGSSIPTAEAQPAVPQDDSPNSLEIAKQAQTRAQAQDGYSKHLLAGGAKGASGSTGASAKKLLG